MAFFLFKTEPDVYSFDDFLRDKEGAAKLWQEAGVLYAAAGVEAGVAESEAQVARLIA